MTLLLFLAPIALADSVSVVVQVDGDQISLVDALFKQGPATLRARARPTLGGTVLAVNSGGMVLASAPLPDPRQRSIITWSGGEMAWLDKSWARVDLDWPEGATRVALGESLMEPRWPGAQAAGAELFEVSTSGDAAERLNMVFLGDGYTEEELDLFASDVDRIAEYIFAEIEPYGSYESAFNVWRIDRASIESGASHLEVEPHDLRDTAYGCFYGCGGIDRLICCDDGDVVGEINDLIPEADGIMVLVNDPTYGGSGGFTYATSYTEGQTGEMVASHELGHSLIGLWDEYDYGANGGGNGGPNCSAESDGSDWEHWLDKSSVDAWSTCSYRDLYRPTQNSCMMNSLQGSYCPICREETVRVIYDHLPGLFASSSEPEGHLELEESLLLTVEAVLPEVDSLVYEWTLEGDWIGEGPSIELDACGESGLLQLELRDETPFVRDDPSELLSDHLRWSLDRPDCAQSGSDSGSGAPEIIFGDLSSCACSTGGGLPATLLLPLAIWRRRRRGFGMPPAGLP